MFVEFAIPLLLDFQRLFLFSQFDDISFILQRSY